MIPYFEWTTIQIGPVTLYVWGLFVAMGFLLGTIIAAWRAKQQKLDSKIIYDLAFWIMLAGIVGGRLGYVLFYDPMTFVESPLQIFKIWDGGMSMFGGLIACAMVGIWYLHCRRVEIIKYVDAAVFGLPFGIWLGRIGCFLIHDHPGAQTNFFLGVKYPDGIVRHDLGLYESITGLSMAIVFIILAKKKLPSLTFSAIFCFWYSISRFILDFWRATDVKYAGLTPGQYFSIALFALGIWLIIKIKKEKKV